MDYALVDSLMREFEQKKSLKIPQDLQFKVTNYAIFIQLDADFWNEMNKNRLSHMLRVVLYVLIQHEVDKNEVASQQKGVMKQLW